jgi:hypothetical protein
MPNTRPKLAAQMGASLDALRGMIRADPALRSLGQMLGSQRVYSERESDLIRAAWRARQDRLAHPREASAHA